MNGNNHRIDGILVIPGHDLLWADEPLESPLMRRAVALAKKLGCSIELFHVSYDSAIEAALFATDDAIVRARQDCTDRDATRLAEIAAWLQGEGLPVTAEVRWDALRIDATLQKIAEAKPDLVMKPGDGHAYIAGITSHADWELARRSPADVWLVNEGAAALKHIVAAIGSTIGNPGEITTARDDSVLRVATWVGTTFEAGIDIVNAYRAPAVAGAMPPAGPPGAPPALPESLEDYTQQLLERHMRAVSELASKHGIPVSTVHVEEGEAGEVIDRLATAVDADLIVMGANNLNRLERFLKPVTVEPVIAMAACDVLVVREPAGRSVRRIRSGGPVGQPAMDLERAIVNPEATFDSPGDVLALHDVSVGFRRRILQVWEYDIRAAMAEENEGGPVQDIEVDRLRDIRAARAALDDLQAAQAADSS
jgi:nucleotide-binding universal stress UspA family protein